MIEYIKYNYINLLINLLVLCFILLVLYWLKSKRNRYILRFYINFILYKVGLKKRMSGVFLHGVHVSESYEPLVDVAKHPKIIINNETVEYPILLRESVAMKIYKVADSLPENVYLKIYSAYRSRLELYSIWKEELDRVTKENPDMGRAEILQLVNSKVTSPNKSMGGHDTGAAVDVALCDKDGNDFDFGTKYHDNHRNRDLTKEQKENRKTLLKLMRTQNFIKNPGQWWHFSYGDKNWSAYKGKRSGAFYDSAEKEFENMGFVRVVKTVIKSVSVK